MKYARWFCALLETRKYIAGPDCEDAVGHTLEDVSGGIVELASGEGVDGDAFLS